LKWKVGSYARRVVMAIFKGMSDRIRDSKMCRESMHKTLYIYMIHDL
jgi:hypothetical protein